MMTKALQLLSILSLRTVGPLREVQSSLVPSPPFLSFLLQALPQIPRYSGHVTGESHF
jgi:hypothetical protein